MKTDPHTNQELRSRLKTKIKVGSCLLLNGEKRVIRYRLTVISTAAAVSVLSSPVHAEEWTGIATGNDGAKPVKIQIDKAGGGVLSIGNEYYVLKLNAGTPVKAETNAINSGPQAAEYMAKVGNQIKRHWRHSLSLPERHIIVRFFIKSDGTIEDLKLDPTSDQRLDGYTVSAFDAVKQAAPFLPPPPALLEDNKVEIKFDFDMKDRSNRLR